MDGGDVGGAVVGQDPLDGDAVSLVVGDGATEEAGRGRRAFVCEDFGVGEPGVVVDGDVDELPACQATAAAGPVIATRPAFAGQAAADALAGAALDPAQLLDVDVDELARP